MARQLSGMVVSNKMSRTVVVKIERKAQHPVYGKLIKKMTKLKADTAGSQYGLGDWVVIEETRPVSSDKHFKVVRKEGGKLGK